LLSKHENNAILGLYLRLEQTSEPSSEYLPNFENSNFYLFKVIQGHRSWCQWKAHM